MGRRRKHGRAISGLLLLDKPSGISSNFALQKARRLFDANKAGHTGSLDPLATGVLPLCFGEATKFSSYLLDADKRYLATFRLGVATSTADSEGEVLAQCSAAHLSQEMLEHELSAFRGEIEQVPPMVSALKMNGQPLYKLARQGIEVERKARAVKVFEYTILAFRAGDVAEVDVDVHCSKGTYIRSLASDLGAAINVGAHVSRLHRSQVGRFSDSQCVSLSELEQAREDHPAEQLDKLLLPIEETIDHLPRIELSDDASHYFGQGQAIADTRVYRLGEQGDRVRVCREDGTFIGVGEITDVGAVAPRRVVVL